MISETAQRASAAIRAETEAATESAAEPSVVYEPLLPGIDHQLRFTSDGVFAVREASAGQALLTIPRDLLISVDTVRVRLCLLLCRP
jgi:hypothetical protein